MTQGEEKIQKDFRRIQGLWTAYQGAEKAEQPKLKKSWTARQRGFIRHLAEDGPAALLRVLITDPAQGVGRFYRTHGGELWFFRLADKQLYDIDQRPFEDYLVQLTESVVGVRRQWLPRLRAWVRFEAPEVETHFLVYNDSPELNIIAVNTFDGFMMRRERGGTWERVPNGTGDILFKTPPEFLTPWSPDFQHGGTGKDLDWLCSLGHFADDGPLSVDDQRCLLRVWILHLFLPALNPVHPIPLHEGVTGSGKSVLGELVGRWLAGPHFEVVDLPAGDATKAEESLKLALWKRPLVVIDNVDSPAPWLEDFLCRVATGVRMSRRRLYTNAEEVHFTPRAGLVITSRDPHFRREDVARRLLPIRFHPIPSDQRRSETEMRADLDARRAAIWADVLTEIARVQDAWPSVKGTLKPSHSLADFSIFGQMLAAADRADPAEWTALMGRLEQAQQRFTVEEDPLVELLREALDDVEGHLPSEPVAELYTTLKDSAFEAGMPWPFKNVAALTKALKNRRPALEQALGVQIVLSNNHKGGQYQVSIMTPTPTARA
jgi:hypothetical protein